MKKATRQFAVRIRNIFSYSSIVEIQKFKTKVLLTYFFCENGFILREIDIKSSEVTINK